MVIPTIVLDAAPQIPPRTWDAADSFVVVKAAVFPETLSSVGRVTTLPASILVDLPEAIDDRVAAFLLAGANVSIVYDDVANTLTISTTGGGGGVSDGDKGDITASSGGTVWTVDAGAITLSKMADLTTSTILGRATAGTGVVEGLTAAQVRTIINVANGATANSSDATLLARANHTGTQLAATISDFATTALATVLTGFSVAGSRVAVAATDTILAAFGKVQKYLNDLSAIAFSGNASDLAGTKTATFISDFSAAADARIGAASINALGDVIITAPSVTQVLKYNGTNWINDTGGGGYTHPNHSGDVTSVGDGAQTIAANAVTNAKAADMAANSIKINNTGVAADPIDGTVAQVKTLLAYTPADIGAATSAQANATHTGDATGATALTLATVNANVGSFGLAASVAQFTVNAKGLITAAANFAISIASTAISDSTAAGRAMLTAATAAAQTALLNVFSVGAKGLVPDPVTSNTTDFLRRDGSWAAPAGGGSPVTVQDEGSNITTALATMNFVGAGVTVTGGATSVVTIPGGGGSSLLVENVQSGTTYTVVATDIDKMTTLPNTSAKTVTLPLNAVTFIAVGSVGYLRNTGPGLLTFTITGAGTINGVAAGSVTLLNGEELAYWKTATDAWDVSVQGVFQALKLAAIADPAAPASGLLVYNSLLANRNMPTFQGPDAKPRALQPMLMRSGTGLWLPQANSATGPGVMGFTAHTITGFTATARALAATNYFTRHKRLGYVSAATAAAVGQRRVAQNLHTIGDGAGVGGFFYAIRFGIADAAAVSGARMFIGMAVGTATPTNVEPSTLVNCIGIGHGAADTNFKIFYGGSAAQTPIDLGSSAPSNTRSTDAYELVLFAPPNTQTIHWQVTRLNTRLMASGTLSGTVGTQVPAATTFLAPWGFRTNNATALAVAIDVFGEQIEDVDA